MVVPTVMKDLNQTINRVTTFDTRLQTLESTFNTLLLALEALPLNIPRPAYTSGDPAQVSNAYSSGDRA